MSSQLAPLEVNALTGEPYLRLKSHPNIIITPPRLTDIPLLPTLLNDPDLHVWLKGPPYPYLPEHADSWIRQITTASEKQLQELAASGGDDSPKIVDFCPVRYIREVKQDGTDILLGDVELHRCNIMELAGPRGVNWEDAPRRQEINDNRKPGDPEILWTVGYFLATSHGGRGIMSDAFDTILREWALPRMGVRRMLATAYSDNHGSRRVLEKSGFVFREVVEGHVQAKGAKHDTNVFDWVL